MNSSARIFLNYRRADSAGWARQLHGDLGERFGAEPEWGCLAGYVVERGAIWAPAIGLAVVLARYAGAGVVECVLSALAGAAVAALLQSGDRTMLLTLHVMLVIGATAAVLAAPSHRAGALLHAATSR